MAVKTEAAIGCLTGHIFADALGSTFEGLPAQQLHERFATPAAAFEYAAELPSLSYTDDGQMLLALAEFLADHESIDPNELMRAYVRAYEPWRGYGRGARVLIEAFRDQADYEHMAQHLFPGGSLGNGGAMRSAPVGLKFSSDYEKIKKEAKQSAWPTHRHELGIEGAQLIALATSYACENQEITPKSLSSFLSEHCETLVFEKRIAQLSGLDNDQDICQFGNGIEAHESVVTALACFALHPTDYVEAITWAIWQAGDTDTIAAMTGALVGAHIGPCFLPELPISKLEVGEAFLESVRETAIKLVAQNNVA